MLIRYIINIKGNEMEDRGVIELSRFMKNLSNLEILHINHCRYEVDGYKELLQNLKYNTKLKELKINDWYEGSEESKTITELKKKYKFIVTSY